MLCYSQLMATFPALGDWESISVYSVGLLASILVIAFIWDKGKKRS